MYKKYNDLGALIRDDEDAMEYYWSLPDYVRSQIDQRPYNINSFESLQDYAENLLRGDD
ncbi:MAG: hypothetical protein BWY15_01221 [Firmicutes bacterium ADurb.Bin193]|nr:MAG: hypothetical protein BWY15_01221 [Firmicutes bacterium ADurb.Bin193]